MDKTRFDENKPFNFAFILQIIIFVTLDFVTSKGGSGYVFHGADPEQNENRYLIGSLSAKRHDISHITKNRLEHLTFVCLS